MVSISHRYIAVLACLLLSPLHACGPAAAPVEFGEDEMREAVEDLWVGVTYSDITDYSDVVNFSIRLVQEGDLVTRKDSHGISTATMQLRGTLGFGGSDEDIQRFRIQGTFTVIGSTLDAGWLRFNAETQEDPPPPFDGSFVAEFQEGRFYDGEVRRGHDAETRFEIARIAAVNRNALVPNQSKDNGI